ncbi:precorrin-6A synthase (deacetylating) [Nocardioides albidus]|uniref:Precorrin-6A synthase (Deacetylating) n=1 Tax=Nocardioides albidus TaxID=1517589 RepID=A0A5C4WLC8_9ACTN|nr:precorrin 6A synthase [Nocardioides albidus]TNM48325.1 precorrin-6A synthase (deacetylating) [Nocardioides albidus]
MIEPVEVRVVGFGMGPQHVTPEAAGALAGCDYALAVSKRDDDPLLAVRRAVCEAHGVELVVVPDPERDRSPGLDRAGYEGAVADWYAARLAAYRSVLTERGGVCAFLVWGDPSLYDGTIRIVRDLAVPYDVLPGISAPQMLAARHGIVLHDVGQPVHVTTARRLRADVAAGQRNVVVMLTGGVDLEGFEDWTIWWGANLGGAGERLVSGLVRDVVEDIGAARVAAKAEAGWVMDLFLLRAPVDGSDGSDGGDGGDAEGSDDGAA